MDSIKKSVSEYLQMRAEYDVSMCEENKILDRLLEIEQKEQGDNYGDDNYPFDMNAARSKYPEYTKDENALYVIRDVNRIMHDKLIGFGSNLLEEFQNYVKMF